MYISVWTRVLQFFMHVVPKTVTQSVQNMLPETYDLTIHHSEHFSNLHESSKPRFRDKNRSGQVKKMWKEETESWRKRKLDDWMRIKPVRLRQHWSNSRTQAYTHLRQKHTPPISSQPFILGSCPLYIFLPNLWLVVAGAFIMKNKGGKDRTERQKRENWL